MFLGKRMITFERSFVGQVINEDVQVIESKEVSYLKQQGFCSDTDVRLYMNKIITQNCLIVPF